MIDSKIRLADLQIQRLTDNYDPLQTLDGRFFRNKIRSLTSLDFFQMLIQGIYSYDIGIVRLHKQRREVYLVCAQKLLLNMF